MGVFLPNGSVLTLNDRRAFAVEANTAVRFTCVGVLNDNNIELSHSAVNLSNVNNNYRLESSPPNGPATVFFRLTVINGNLTCRSRTSGRERSVYIGGIKV